MLKVLNLTQPFFCFFLGFISTHIAMILFRFDPVSFFYFLDHIILLFSRHLWEVGAKKMPAYAGKISAEGEGFELS